MMQKRILGLALMAAVIIPSMSAQAAPVLLADVATGQVLISEEGTRPWNPASVTKLMTVYVALKQMRAGKYNLDTPLAVSARAASAPPSKIAVKPGQTLTLDNALKILMVKSANDIAVVVAEGVGGTVEHFAEMMNREAAALGMRESHFVNPNGLHAEGQQTSARDMAILARQLLLEFPEHRGFFGIRAIQLGDRVMENTNGVIGRYPGATGMKTGFICSSGFNVVSTAYRNGRELIAVVMGSPSATERTLKTMELLDTGFMRPVSGPTLAALQASAETTAPDMREAICGRRVPVETVAAVTAAQGEAAASSETVAATVLTKLGPRDSFEPIQVAIGRAAKIEPIAVASTPSQDKAPRSEVKQVVDIKPAAKGRQVVALPVKPTPAPKQQGVASVALQSPALPQGAVLGPPIRPAGLERTN